MARSIEEMASKGAAKLSAKTGVMAANYNAAKSRMVSNYGNLPFGPATKSAYSAGISAATYRTPDVSKWQTNWKAGVTR